MPFAKQICANCGAGFLILDRRKGGTHPSRAICVDCQKTMNALKMQAAIDTVQQDVTTYDKATRQDGPDCCANCIYWKSDKATNKFWKKCELGLSSDEDTDEPMGFVYMLDKCGNHERK